MVAHMHGIDGCSDNGSKVPGAGLTEQYTKVRSARNHAMNCFHEGDTPKTQAAIAVADAEEAKFRNMLLDCETELAKVPTFVAMADSMNDDHNKTAKELEQAETELDLAQDSIGLQVLQIANLNQEVGRLKEIIRQMTSGGQP